MIRVSYVRPVPLVAVLAVLVASIALSDAGENELSSPPPQGAGGAGGVLGFRGFRLSETNANWSFRSGEMTLDNEWEVYHWGYGTGYTNGDHHAVAAANFSTRVTQRALRLSGGQLVFDHHGLKRQFPVVGLDVEIYVRPTSLEALLSQFLRRIAELERAVN